MSGMNSWLPEPVVQAVEQLLSGIALNNEIQTAMMEEDALQKLPSFLAAYVRNQFRFCTGNVALTESCRSASGSQNLHVDDVSMVIIKAPAERLKRHSILTDL